MSANSTKHTMRDGQPVRYWQFRNLVTAGQLLVVALMVGGALIWALTEGNGARVIGEYVSFAQGLSDFAHNSMKLPWER